MLPFANLSGDPQQDYFCHGLTDDLTTELSRFVSLSVVSSTTASAYQGRLGQSAASRELGARFVLEGSVQKTPDRVRINIQLLDGPSDHHIWADRFDRDISDLFSLQDEIIESVVAAMALRIEASERARAMRKPTGSLSAYDAYHKGAYLWFVHLTTDETKKTLLECRRWLKTATSLDPGYARAWGWLALTYVQTWLQSWSGKASLDRAGQLARRALMIDGDDYCVHWINALLPTECPQVRSRAERIRPGDIDERQRRKSAR